jgi:hypothetical protein
MHVLVAGNNRCVLFHLIFEQLLEVLESWDNKLQTCSNLQLKNGTQ